MKVAFLILAHQDFAHLQRLVGQLLAVDCDVYIHVDKKVRRPPSIDHGRVRFVDDRVDIAWGGFSIVRATLNLLEEAYRRGGYSHFALLSGADYPIRPLPELYAHLAQSGADHINVVRLGGSPDKPVSRVLVPYFEGAMRGSARSFGRVGSALANHLARAFYRRTGRGRRLPLPISHFYCGSQWFCLRAGSVQHILAFLAARPDFVRFCRRALVPDEFFFQTVLMAASDAKTQPNLHFAIWNGGYSPAVLNESHLAEVQEAYRRGPGRGGPLFFGRKFNSLESAGLLSAIDARLAAAPQGGPELPPDCAKSTLQEPNHYVKG